MARTRSSIAGRVDVTALLFEGRRVTVRVYLPPDYEGGRRRYPVLYMFDGHNLFDRTTSTYNKEWRVDETMEWIAAETTHSPAIVVGIDAPQTRHERFAMYSLGQWDLRNSSRGRRQGRIVGYGERTAQFLLGDVKAYIERVYRASPDRDEVGVGGSSMGAYMALYCATVSPHLVSKVIALSPVLLDFPMRGDRMRGLIAANKASRSQRYFLQMGDRERLDYASPTQLVDHLWQVRDALAGAGHRELYARVIPRGRHDEHSWAKQFPGAYLWAFHGVEPEPWP